MSTPDQTHNALTQKPDSARITNHEALVPLGTGLHEEHFAGPLQEIVIEERERVAPPQFSFKDFAQEITSQEKEKFNRYGKPLSYGEYVQALFENPLRHVRNASGMIRDAMLEYGSHRERIEGRDILVFDFVKKPWESQRLGDRKVPCGQDIAIYEIFQSLQNDSRLAFGSRGIIVNGPPGAGKTLLVKVVFSDLIEHFTSQSENGAVLRPFFRFESEGQLRRMGFETPMSEPFVEDENEGITIHPSVSIDPLFLIPNQRGNRGATASHRENLLSRLEQHLEGSHQPDVLRSLNRNYFLRGQMDATSQGIMEALMRSYKGDWQKAFEAHVRVERVPLNARMGRGIVTIPPFRDPSADAGELFRSSPFASQEIPEQIRYRSQDITVTQSWALSAHRGVLHIEDGFRPREHEGRPDDLSHLNYLKPITGQGETNIVKPGSPPLLVGIDTVVVIDVNDEHAVIKRQSANWEPFIQEYRSINVGSIVRFKEEEAANHAKLEQMLPHGVSATAHALDTLCLFVTATRLFKPSPDSLKEIDGNLHEGVVSMNQVSKALLLQSSNLQEIGKFLNIPQATVKSVIRHTDRIATQYDRDITDPLFPYYDGGIGISTRQTEDLIREALAQLEDGSDFTAIKVMQFLDEKAKKQSFGYYKELQSLRAALLKQQSSSGKPYTDKELDALIPFQEPKAILDSVRTYAITRVSQDIDQALEISVNKDASFQLNQYIAHVKAFIMKGSYPVTPHYRTGSSRMNQDGGADEALLSAIEQKFLDVSSARSVSHRSDFLGKIGAWGQENPGQVIEENVRNIFPKLFIQIATDIEKTFEKIRGRLLEAAKVYNADKEQLESDLASLDPKYTERAELWIKTTARLKDLGYSERSMAEHIVWALEKPKTP